MKYIALLIASFALSSPGPYRWEQALPPGHGCFQEDCVEGQWPMALLPVRAFGDQLWMTGQNKSWSSTDGIHWTAHTKDDWGERIGGQVVYFKEGLWMYGGMKYATSEFTNEIWYSTDGSNWVLQAARGKWSPRKSHQLIVFSNRLWLFGGDISVDKDKAPTDFANDAWVSDDGLRWTLVTANLPWAKRGSPRMEVFKNELWMFGGQGMADIWHSKDGIQWDKIPAEAPWMARYDQGTAVFDDKVWVYGGREAEPRNAYNDVWSSDDGIHWTVFMNHAPWTPRSGVHSTVFNNKLWIYAGKHTGAPDNWNKDIWVMSRN